MFKCSRRNTSFFEIGELVSQKQHHQKNVPRDTVFVVWSFDYPVGVVVISVEKPGYRLLARTGTVSDLVTVQTKIVLQVFEFDNATAGNVTVVCSKWVQPDR